MTSERILYTITDANNEEPFFRGITYSKGNVYASNRALFARVKYDIPKEYKNKTVLSTGGTSSIDTNQFSRMCYAVDDYLKNKERDTIDLMVLNDRLSLSDTISTFIDSPIRHIKIGSCYYSIENLKKFCSITDELFLFQAGISKLKDVTAIIAKDSDSVIMLACCDNEKTKGKPYIDYKSGDVKDSEYGLRDLLSIIKKEIKKEEKKINKVKTSKEEKDIEKCISKLNKQMESLQKIIDCIDGREKS